MRLMISLLALVMTGCALKAPVLAPALPPVDLLEDCHTPAVDASTNGGLAKGVRSLKDALKACNLDKKALRDWADKATQ